jgi:putative PIN family toxin of toxin-antitoxin system
MRVVLDTNVLVSALLLKGSQPARLLAQWREGKFVLLTAREQLEELSRVTRYPRIRERVNTSLAGRLLNDLRDLAVVVSSLPKVEISPDPYDDYLLSIAQGGSAQYLITGDRRDLLGLKQHGGTTILSVTEFLSNPNRR